jgi:hypothetical protein
MIHLGDEAQVEARFSLFGDSATLDTRWTHLMELSGDMGHVESRFVLFGDSVSVSAR